MPSLGNGAGQKQITGKLIYVGRTVNPRTRTVLVRTELENRRRAPEAGHAGQHADPARRPSNW
ncbi:hypothetical protein ACU4GD_26075 [Cupriavidus basilensis]